MLKEWMTENTIWEVHCSWTDEPVYSARYRGTPGFAQALNYIVSKGWSVFSIDPEVEPNSNRGVIYVDGIEH